MVPSPLALGALVASIAVQLAHATDSWQTPLSNPARTINGIAPTTRSHWMRRANQALADILGEIAAIQNCTSILTDPKGPYNLSAGETLSAFSQLSLYTNAESCPMCASAIRWAGFKEYIYGTSIDRLIEEGWGQIRISSMEVFRQSFDLDSTTKLMGEVLTNETDPYFLWQFNPEYKCPSTCVRRNGVCKAG